MSELARVRTQRDGPTQLVHITGEVDLSNARDVIDAVGHAVPDDVTLIVLDLTDTTYVDSAAIAALFRLAERLRDRRQDLRLVVPQHSPIRAVVELTRLSQVIPVDEVAPTDVGDLPAPTRPYAAVPHFAEAASSAGREAVGMGGSEGEVERDDPPRQRNA
ncbi:MAG: STAS domain-containing protein [Dermatophilaceae bacterium]|nr:STAS domain-containing protein [Dermatophilaceae bacterium]